VNRSHDSNFGKQKACLPADIEYLYYFLVLSGRGVNARARNIGNNMSIVGRELPLWGGVVHLMFSRFAGSASLAG
jgi:hypothetical protein